MIELPEGTKKRQYQPATCIHVDDRHCRYLKRTPAIYAAGVPGISETGLVTISATLAPLWEELSSAFQNKSGQLISCRKAGRQSLASALHLTH
jgi:hypothetical protein